MIRNFQQYIYWAELEAIPNTNKNNNQEKIAIFLTVMKDR